MLAARKVAEIIALIPLTPQQAFLEGLEAFLNINPSQTIQTFIKYNQAYATYSRNIKAFLRQNPTVRYYAIPSLGLIGEYSPGICSGELVKHTVLNPNNVVYLKLETQEGLIFNELNPLKNNFKPEEVLCNPYRINLKYENLTCDSALVIVNPWANEMQHLTLVALEEGIDIAYSFSDKPITFIVDNGYKIYVGGNQNDRFVIKTSGVGGRLDASLGSDLLDLRFYSSDNNTITIDLVNGILNEEASSRLTIENFERILGRSQQKDLIFPTHRTEFIDLQGGLASDFDQIIITPHIGNDHLEIVVRAQTSIKNDASHGDYLYLVPGINKSFDDTVNPTQLSELCVSNLTTTVNHTLLFNYDLEDLHSIEPKVDEQALFFNFFFNDTHPFANHSLALTNLPTSAQYFFKEDTLLKIGKKNNLYAFQTSVLPVPHLIERYAPLARRLGITLFIHQSLNNEVIVIGHTHHQVLQNDLFASKTHLVANGGGNNYVIKPNAQTPFSTPDVIIYQITADEQQHVLDLRDINAEFNGGLLNNPLIDIVVLAVDQDIKLAVLHKSLEVNTDNLYQMTPVIKILLKQGAQWYPKITTLFNRVPLQLVKIAANFWQLHPTPLNFEADVENIILTHDDIEKDNQIFLHRPIHQQHWLRDGSDLWLTTLFSTTSDFNKNYTLLFRDFYQHAKMRTLRLMFSNVTLLLSECAEEIAHAEDIQKKLTLLEFNAWNEVSKYRIYPEEQPNLPPLPIKLLDHRASHAFKILTAESVTSGATRSQGWLNSLFNMFIEPFRSVVATLLPRDNQPIVAWAAANNATAHHPSQSLDHCITGVQYGGTNRTGITCYTKNMQMFIFPKNEQAKIASLEDHYSEQAFRPIEYNGRPAVYFEGDNSNVFYVPEIPENPLDHFNDQLLLWQVLFYEGKKFCRWWKNFFSAKTNCSHRLTDESAKTVVTDTMKISWKESLDNLEKQLIDINSFAVESVDVRWIRFILEDRREELHYINQLSRVNLETIKTFTENLRAMQEELVDIMIDLNRTVIQQDDDFACPTHDTSSFRYKQQEFSALLACNKSSKVTPWGFFKEPSTRKNITIALCDSSQAKAMTAFKGY